MLPFPACPAQAGGGAGEKGDDRSRGVGAPYRGHGANVLEPDLWGLQPVPTTSICTLKFQQVTEASGSSPRVLTREQGLGRVQ